MLRKRKLSMDLRNTGYMVGDATQVLDMGILAGVTKF